MAKSSDLRRRLGAGLVPIRKKGKLPHDTLEAAYDDGRPRALTAFLRMGQEYLNFAADRRGFYIAMFESGISIAGRCRARFMRAIRWAGFSG